MKLPGLPQLSISEWSIPQRVDLSVMWKDIAKTVNGNAAIGTVDSFRTADLPPHPAIGNYAVVTDSSVSTVGHAVAGGGNIICLVWWNGSSWNIFGV
jgi:hypothetical protein